MRFFASYFHFIKVDVLSQSENEYVQWKSYIETQLKRFCDSIFNDKRESLTDLRIYTRPFSREETQESTKSSFATQYKFSESFMVGIKFSRSGGGSCIDLRPTVAQFCLVIDMHRIDKQVNNLKIMHYTRDQLPSSLVNKY